MGRRTSTGAAAATHDWLDEEAGPVVRPYTVTGGRARTNAGNLSMLTYVETRYLPEADPVHLAQLQPEHQAILVLARTAMSVAEVSARLDLPMGVVRVLLGDLIQAGLVTSFDSDAHVHPPDKDILQAVIDGLRSL